VSCHEPSAGATALEAQTAVVALVGNPNVGKSTLFNSLTKARQAIVNAPGTTVEMASGAWKAAGVRLLDLPGAYSLLARSPDEEVTSCTLGGQGSCGAVDLAVVLLDATALSRSLYLAGQVGLTGVPMVAAVTMVDVARARGITVDLQALRERLGVPVVGLDPRAGGDADVLARLVRAALDTPSRLRLPDTLAPETSEHPLAGVDRRFDEAEHLFAWVAQVQAEVSTTPDEHKPTRSDAVDSWLLRPWVGGPVFLAVLWAVFNLVTVVAAPLMDALDWLVTDLLGGWVVEGLDAVGSPVWLTGFVEDGLLVGVATVASFLPLMALMFIAVGLLEDSGYLSRASFVADRAMRAIGLDGRAVLPIVVGFGCNLPALAALRVLPNARQRLLTAMLLPFASCTARLAVYLVLATAFFPGYAGTVVFAMYVLSGLMVIGAGLLLRHTRFRDIERETLVLALPAYQRPRVRALLTSAATRTGVFVARAGKIIVLALAVLWVFMAIPVSGSHAVGDVPVEDSLYGRAATTVAPVFTPAGFGDWGTTSALVSGVVAKEVVVGALEQAYGTSGEDLVDAFDRASGGHGQAAALAFLVFVLVYVPCVAVAAELIRQIGARWTLLSLSGSLVTAWVMAVVVFQVGSRL